MKIIGLGVQSGERRIMGLGVQSMERRGVRQYKP
jgi:hypothetical protein